MTEPGNAQNPNADCAADSKSASTGAEGGDPPKRKKAATKEDRAYKSDHKEASVAVDSTDEEQQFQRMIEAQGGECTEFWRTKYEKEAKRNWDIFYKQNETRFFKNRLFAAKRCLISQFAGTTCSGSFWRLNPGLPNRKTRKSARLCSKCVVRYCVTSDVRLPGRLAAVAATLFSPCCKTIRAW